MESEQRVQTEGSQVWVSKRLGFGSFRTVASALQDPDDVERHRFRGVERAKKLLPGDMIADAGVSVRHLAEVLADLGAGTGESRSPASRFQAS